MSKTSIRSTQRLSKFGSTKRSGCMPRPDIFELMQGIPKQLDHFNDNWTFKEQISYAKNICAFTHENMSKEVETLFFDPSRDGLATLCSKVSEVVFKSDTFIGVQEYDRGATYFMHSIPFNAQFYMVEGKFFYEMPHEALKIGFAHLYEAMRQVFPVAVLDHLSDDEFTGHFLESVVEYFLHNDEEDPDEDVLNRKTAKYWAREYHKASRKLTEYGRKDLAVFFGYIPKKPRQKRLKELLAKGLSLDMGVLAKFVDSEDEDNGCLGYMDFFGLLYDMDSMFENEFLENHMSIANNSGISFPCGFMKYVEGKLLQRTTKADEAEFLRVCEFLEEFVNFLYGQS